MKFRIILRLFVVIMFAAIIILAYRQLSNTTGKKIDITPTPSVSAKNSTITTTIPESNKETLGTSNDKLIEIIGPISSVSGPVDYKKSTIIQIDATKIYIPENIQIISNSGKILSRSMLIKGVQIDATIFPIQDGAEATQIRLTDVP